MHTLPPCLDRFPRLAVLRTNYTKQQRTLGFESHFAIEKVWFTSQHEHRRRSFPQIDLWGIENRSANPSALMGSNRRRRTFPHPSQSQKHFCGSITSVLLGFQNLSQTD